MRKDAAGPQGSGYSVQVSFSARYRRPLKFGLVRIHLNPNSLNRSTTLQTAFATVG